MLERVNLPADVKKLDQKQKRELASDIRKFINELSDKTPIHLGSNLGTVELTIALLSVFWVPEDKVFFDTGHQSYPFKILTGRKDRMHTIRQPGGLSAFQNPEESPYDVYGGGHSGNAISVALGMASGPKQNWVVPVIGDAAIANGLAFEALNDLTNHPIAAKKLIVVLNDNGMSISKTMGSLASTLGRIRLRRFYMGSERLARKILDTSKFGRKTMHAGARLQRWVEGRLYGKNMFELLGMHYIGPVNGHKIAEIEAALKRAQFLKGPVLVHVKTTKGRQNKGVEGVGPHFSPSPFKTISYGGFCADWLLKNAKENGKIHVINPAMTEGTGYGRFAHELPSQYHDVGIAEEHALSLASGMALAELRPYVHIYSTFLQRGYDQLVHDIDRLNLPVTVLIDRAGVSAGDGRTHNGTLDVAMINTLTNFEIMAPSNKEEAAWMLEYSLQAKNPLAIRFANKPIADDNFNEQKTSHGKWKEVVSQGNAKTIISYGWHLKELKEKIVKEKLPYTLVNALFIKPLDEDYIASKLANKTSWEVVEGLEGQNGLKEAIALKLLETKNNF